MLHFQTWKKVVIIGACLIGLIATMPNFFYADAQRAGDARGALSKLQQRGVLENLELRDEALQQEVAALREQADSWPSFLPAGVVNLGLDLQGGAHFLLEVRADQVIEARLRTVRGRIGEALREGGAPLYRYAPPAATPDDAIVVSIEDPNTIEAARAALEGLAEPIDDGAFSGSDLSVTLLEDGKSFQLEFTEAARAAITRVAVNRTIEVLRYRVDALGTREPTIASQGEDRILLQLPGEENVDLTDVLRPSQLTFHMVADPGVDYEGEVVQMPYDEDLNPEDAGLVVPVFQKVEIAGDSLLEAGQGYDSQNRVGVNIRFDTEGSRVFRRLSTQYLNHRFAIVLDGKVISAPAFRAEIVDGRAIITGSFTVSSAQALAINLSSGSLPAEVRIEESSFVGPELGADSIAAGQLAVIVGFVGVLVFMWLSYGLFGLFANVALLMNVVLIFGALSLLGATLTLPGIAGIVLTIGMAVDANVLVFERIREELAAGRRPASAIETGYSRALSAIIDANVTTFMAALILFALGSGPVRGFAVTLGIGILTSVFTAVMLTRLFVSQWFAVRRPKQLEI